MDSIMQRKTIARVVKTVPADAVWGVTTLHTEHCGDGHYQKKPCRDCPWRKDAPVGRFPAEAFRLSANTAYDASMHTFTCHMAGRDNPATCAGFLLRNSENNVSVRIAASMGRYEPSEVSSDVALYESYREMAIANGVAENDPAIAPCRADWE